MSNTNFMEKLLDGVEVEWKPLGDISEIYGGLSGKSKADFENGNASYISYKNIFDNIEVNFDKLESVKVSDSENQHEVRYGDVLFTGSSETADEAGMSSSVTTKFKGSVYLNSFSFGLRFNDNIKITPEFSKYLFRSHFMRIGIAKTASGVTRFNISKARFKTIPIPIPTLEIQTEIVRILDTFTELTARKKQYTYYRDQLLTFEEGKVEWKTLGEVIKLQRGKRLIKSQLEKFGNYAVYQNCMTPLGYYHESNVKSDTTFIISAGAAGEIGYSDVDFWAADDVYFFLTPNNIESKFLYHFLLTQQNKISAQVRRASIPRLSKTVVEKLLIPIPYPGDTDKSLAEQARIVAILDKFDALTNSITEGLPREIELRQKQYEYYRNMLLSFPEPKANV